MRILVHEAPTTVDLASFAGTTDEGAPVAQSSGCMTREVLEQCYRTRGVVGAEVLLIEEATGVFLPLPGSLAPADVAFSSATAVAVGTDPFMAQPKIMRRTISSFSSWNTSSVVTPKSAMLRGVAFGASVWVAVGDSDGVDAYALVSSDDGTNWHEVPTVAGGLRGVCHASLFVAVGLAGLVVTSPDGSVWTKRTIGTSTNLEGIIFNSDWGLFVAYGRRVIFTSPDGITWTQRLNSPDVLSAFASGDGVTWQSIGAVPSGTIGATPVGAGHVCVWGNGVEVTWTMEGTSIAGVRRVLPRGFSAKSVRLWKEAGVVVAVGETADGVSCILSGQSGQGTQWESPTWRTDSANVSLTAACRGGGSWMAFGPKGVSLASYSSPNGRSWGLEGYLPGVPDESVALSAAYGNGLFVVAVQEPTASSVLVGPGLTWTRIVVPNKFRTVCFGDGIFVAAGDCSSGDMYVAISSNGVNWEEVPTGLATAGYTVGGVAYGGGKYVAIGWRWSDQRIVSCMSLDGFRWSANTDTVEYGTVYGVCYVGDGTFVAYGLSTADTLVVMVSTDGISWIRKTVPISFMPLVIGFDNGLTAIVGDGVWIQSTDVGRTWTEGTFTSPPSNRLYVFRDPIPRNQVLTWGQLTAATVAAGAGNYWAARAPMAVSKGTSWAGSDGSTSWVIGGIASSGIPEATNQVYNSGTNAWVTNNAVKPAPTGGSADFGNGYLPSNVICCGGWTNTTGWRTNVDAFGVAMGTFVAKAAMPRASFGGGVSAVGVDAIYRMGGWGGGGNSHTADSYSLSANAWTTRASTADPVHMYHSVAVGLGGDVFMPGGITPAPDVSNNNHTRYLRAANAYLVLPGLPFSEPGLCASRSLEGRDGGRYVASGTLGTTRWNHATAAWTAGLPVKTPTTSGSESALGSVAGGMLSTGGMYPGALSGCQRYMF